MLYYGINPVIESLRSSRPPKLIHIDQRKNSPAIATIIRLAAERGVEVCRVEEVEKVSGSREDQGVCAETDKQMVKGLRIEDMPDRLVMFDGIQDPHNFGAALRVCECFGFRDILFHKGDSCGLTPAAIKASAGAAFHVNLHAQNLNLAVKKLLKEEYALIVFEGEGDTSLYELELPRRFCLVIGSEGRGVRFNIRRAAAHQVRIPLHGKIGSLNVSCALTAALSEVARRGG